MVVRRNLYAAVVQECGLSAVPVQPDVPWLHVMQQPTARGTAQVVFHAAAGEALQQVELATAAGRVQLRTRQGWPGLRSPPRVVKRLLSIHTGKRRWMVSTVCRGDGQKLMVSLDGGDLRRARALLVAPLETGSLELPARDGSFVAVVGDFRQGQWVVAESIPWQSGAWRLEIDADRATMLTLVCPADSSSTGDISSK